MSRRFFFLFLVFCCGKFVPTAPARDAESSGVRKLEDIVIYRDDKFYSAFPSIARVANGDLLAAFRRAPNRRTFGQTGFTHTDPNSYLVSVRSRDDGKTWSREPRLIFAHPFGGSQDPCLLPLRDNSILCSSYGWAWLPAKASAPLTNAFHHGDFYFLGGYMMRSEDGGNTWGNLIVPPPCRDEGVWDPFGKPVPAYNRGAMCEGRDGRIFWVIASRDAPSSNKTSTHLMISSDKGTTWKYSYPVGRDEKITFNETSIYETPKGDLIAFMRTENFDDHTVIARSTDGGKSFTRWEDAGFQGHPHFALRLPDERVLLVYGYRHAPFGIRARVLNADCSDATTAREIILRDDGGGFDLGYPWATMLSENRALIVYYFNQNDGPRYIAGTIVAVD